MKNFLFVILKVEVKLKLFIDGKLIFGKSIILERKVIVWWEGYVVFVL